MLAIQGSGLEGCLQFRVWIRGTATKRIEHCMIEHLTLIITINNVVCTYVC